MDDLTSNEFPITVLKMYFITIKIAGLIRIYAETA